MSPPAAPRSLILVVDDQPLNVALLKKALEREGYEVITAAGGEEALQRVAERRPDLVLLDLMMPGIDGIEVCRRLQQEETTRGIPVIFVTARTEKETRLQGLNVGAVDYLTKPVDLDETCARVRTQLRLVAVNRDLIDLQRRLDESRRAAAIGAVTQGIVHNLNNLLGVAVGYLDNIRVHSDKPEIVAKNALHADVAVERIVGIVRQMSALLVRSRPPLTQASVQHLLDDAVVRFQTEHRIEASVQIDNPVGALAIATNIENFEDIISRVLINAWESYGAASGTDRPLALTTALIERGPGKDMVEILVTDRGGGIDPVIRDRIFEPFVGTKKGVGVGMGLTVARHLLRNLGGDITVDAAAGAGTLVRLTHPVADSRRTEGFESSSFSR